MTLREIAKGHENFSCFAGLCRGPSRYFLRSLYALAPLREIHLPSGAVVQNWCTMRQNEMPFCSSQFHSNQGIQATPRIRLLQNASISPHFPVNNLPPPSGSNKHRTSSFVIFFHPASCIRNPTFLPVIFETLSTYDDLARPLAGTKKFEPRIVRMPRIGMKTRATFVQFV